MALVADVGVRLVERQAEVASVGGRQAAGTDHRREGSRDHGCRGRDEVDPTWQLSAHIRRHVCQQSFVTIPRRLSDHSTTKVTT